MELIAAIVLVSLSALGLALGLVLTGRPPRASCGGTDCLGACPGCPRQKGTPDA